MGGQSHVGEGEVQGKRGEVRRAIAHRRKLCPSPAPALRPPESWRRRKKRGRKEKARVGKISVTVRLLLHMERDRGSVQECVGRMAENVSIAAINERSITGTNLSRRGGRPEVDWRPVLGLNDGCCLHDGWGGVWVGGGGRQGGEEDSRSEGGCADRDDGGPDWKGADGVQSV